GAGDSRQGENSRRPGAQAATDTRGPAGERHGFLPADGIPGSAETGADRKSAGIPLADARLDPSPPAHAGRAHRRDSRRARLPEKRDCGAAREARDLAAPALEELHRALMLLGRLPASKRAEIAPLAGARVLLARIEPVLARFQLADHDIDQRSGVWTGSSPLRERALDREKIPPGEPLLQRLAQEIGGMQRGDGADLARAGVIREEATARSQDAFLDAEQCLRGGSAEADQDVGIGELDLAQNEGQADRGLL